jgi:hypothetical protein
LSCIIDKLFCTWPLPRAKEGLKEKHCLQKVDVNNSNDLIYMKFIHGFSDSILLTSLELESHTNSAKMNICELVTLKVSDLLHPHMCPFMVCTGPSEDLYLSRKPFMINSNSVLTVRLCSNVATLV